MQWRPEVLVVPAEGRVDGLRHPVEKGRENGSRPIIMIIMQATGTFEVKITPQPVDENGDATLGRMTIDKQLHGDLEGVSKGQMLTAGTSVKGSAGYVAIERVSGTLKVRKGSFILQHHATMTRGTPQLSITVVPDSGTDQLTGIAGKMDIQIADGKHSYQFEYTVA